MNYDGELKKQAGKKLLLETDFFTFTRWNFKQCTKQSFLVSEHHKVLANAFQKVLDGKIKRLKIHIPPRYSKTEFVKSFCAAGFARNPASQFIYTSYSDKLALKCSKEIRDMITSDKYQELWPIQIKQDTRAKGLWETEDDGGVFATSIGGQITGFGAGKMYGYKSNTQWKFNGAIIIDDPLKVQDRHSKPARDESIDYFDSTLRSRTNSSDTPIILIMQRVHPEDLAGWIDENEGEEWTTINLPAIKEGVVDPTGTPLWPNKHTIEELIAMSKNNEMFMAQYMQQPVTLGGNIIKPSEFGRYAILPFLRKRFITADTALKDKEHNDYTVFQCWGVGHDNKLYLIDNLRIKIQSKDLKQRFKDFWNKHKNSLDANQYGYLSCAYIEDKSSGTQLIQEVKADAKIPISPIPRTRSKLERVVDILLPRMYMVMIPEEAEWVSDFFNECEQFTAEMSHKHDDQIDPMVDAVEIGSGESSHNPDIISKRLNDRLNSSSRRRMRRR